MKVRITIICIFLSMLIASAVCAQKVYYWKDEKGVMNATTTPPPDNIKKYEADSYGKPGSPEEIRKYQAEQKAKEQGRETELRQRQQTNRAQEEAQKQRNKEPVEKSRVALEMKRLEQKKAGLGSWKEGVEAVEKSIEHLKNDPEQYFYNKEQAEKETQPVVIVVPR